MRDLEKQPYTADEQRVAEFFSECGVGGGDDPIGSIIASHAYLAAERNRYRKTLEIIAGHPQCVLESMQAKAALDNIGPPVTNGERDATS
jgi:hypothetical protein